MTEKINTNRENSRRYVVCTDLYPLAQEREASGQTIAVKKLVEDSKSMGMDIAAVVIFCQALSKTPQLKTEAFDLSGIKVIRTPVFGFRDFFMSKLSRIFLKRQFEDVFFTDIISHMALSFYRANEIINADNKYRHHFVAHRGDFNTRCLSYAYNYSDIVAARSINIKRELESCFGKNKNISIVYSGIEGGFISSLKNDGGDGFDRKFEANGVLNFVYAGNLIPLKNVNSSIYAMKMLFDAGIDINFNILGEGPEKQSLIDLVEQLGLKDKVKFHGWVDKDRVKFFYLTSDIYIMVSKPETFGLSYIESMACGCIALTHSKEGVDGIVNHMSNGLVSDSTKSEDIFVSILDFLKAPKEMKLNILKNSIETARRYTHENAALNYIKVFKG